MFDVSLLLSTLILINTLKGRYNYLHNMRALRLSDRHLSWMSAHPASLIFADLSTIEASPGTMFLP